MNKKIFWGVKIVVALLVTATVITIDLTQTGNVKKPDTPVLLKTYITPFSPYGPNGEEPLGWFGELLKDKLNIEIQIQPEVLVFGYEGFVKDADLYSFWGEVTYYEAVQEGKLKNLEEEIQKKPEVFSRYANAINHIKEDTYEHTGKEGVFGIPIELSSFEDSGWECYCISILSAAKNPEKAMDLITYSASEEGIMNIAFGPEGQMWKKEDGKYILIQDWYKMDQYDEKGSEIKFVETKHGKESFHRARCKMELVGNEALGRELIGEKNDSE